MIKQNINKVVFIVTGMLVMTTVAQAHPKPKPQPLWTYSAPSPSSVSVSDGGSATVIYTVTSHTNKPKSLVLQTKPPAHYPLTPGITASACKLPTKGSTCTLTITIDGNQVPTDGIHGGPYLCQGDSNGTPNSNQCYQPSAAHSLNITKNTTQPTSLELSVSNLALSVIGYTEYGVTGTPASGAARSITVTNTGSNTANNLAFTYPTGSTGAPTTTTTTTCNSTLAAGGTCTITIHPGNTATSDGTSPCTSGVAPIPQTILVSADNADDVSSNVVILGYGRAYQLGRVDGNFLVVGECTSVYMPDAPSLPAMIALHQNLFGQGVLQSIATDKGYDSFDNERRLEAAGVKDIYLPIPNRTLEAPLEKTPGPIRQLLHDRPAGIEPLIGHTKQGGQMGRSRMKSDETTKSAGYASVLGFNARQFTRYLAGEVRPKIDKIAGVAANDCHLVEKAAIKQG